MKNNKSTIKQSLIQVKKTLILQDIEDIKIKKSKNQTLTKNTTIKKEGEYKALRTAYKNVINVITNILDNIEDEQTNGKVNVIGTTRILENRNKNKIKGYVCLVCVPCFLLWPVRILLSINADAASLNLSFSPICQDVRRRSHLL